MKKNFKKLFVLFLSVMACLSSVMVAYAETAPQTLKATNYDLTNPPVSFPATTHVKKTTDGKYIFCTYYSKKPPVKSVNFTRGSLVKDNGMNYILKQSYSAKNDSEYFIYQTALWSYMVDKGIMKGPHYTLTKFNSQLKSNNSASAKKIKELVANAKKAGANDTTAPTIKVNAGAGTFTLDSTGKRYVSNAITVTSSTGSYNVSLTSAPEGTVVVKDGNTFTITVQADKVTNLKTNISFKVSNSKDVYTSYYYNPSNANYQIMAAVYKDTKTASATGSLTITKNASVPFLKVDAETNEAISGAELQLTNSAGTVIKTWTSTTEAEVITGLSEGTYTLTETKAPEGYKTIETSVKFSINSQGKILDANGKEITQVVIKNEKKTGGVSISKQDITNKEELPGATLVVKDYDGNVIEEWVSTNEPHIIENLKPGIYTLTEIVAPEGYILSAETITFTVEDDGTITKVVMYNTPDSKEVEVPEDKGEEVPVENTASFKTMTSSLMGIIVIIAGSCMIFKNSKKKEVK